MSKDFIKNNVKYLPNALFAISVVFIVLTVARVSGYASTSERITKAVDTAKTQDSNNEETVKKLLEKDNEIANKLKQKNMFVPPPPKANPPVCIGIIGSSAIINNKYYKVGDKIGAAELIAIGTKDVTIKWEDKEMKLVPFALNNQSSPGSGGKRPSPKSDDKGDKSNDSAKVTIVENVPPRPGMMGPGGGRGGFMNMSSDERQAMIDRYRSMSPEEQNRFREERRREMERNGFGGFGGRGDRGR